MATNIVDTNGIIQGSSETLSTIHQNKGWGVNYISQNYYSSMNLWHQGNGTGGTGTISINTLFLFPFMCQSTAYFSSIAIWLRTGVALSNINLGIYKNNELTGKPTGDPIPGTTSGSLPTTSSGSLISYSFSSPLLLEGGKTYWLASVVDTAGLVFNGNSASNILSNIGYNLFTAANASGGWSQSFTYNAVLPTIGSPLTISAASSNRQTALLRAT